MTVKITLACTECKQRNYNTCLLYTSGQIRTTVKSMRFNSCHTIGYFESRIFPLRRITD